MNDDSILGATLGQLGQTAKKVGQQIIKEPGEMAQDLGGQVGGVKSGESKPQENKLQKQWQSDEERIKFLKGLYGSIDAEQKLPEQKSDYHKTSASPLVSSSLEKPSEFQEQIKDKSPEEQKELIALRNQLHKEVYYDPTFNPVKKQEERPAEKVENEKKKEMMDLQEKEDKKPQPIAVVREQNKAEQFRGAAG